MKLLYSLLVLILMTSAVNALAVSISMSDGSSTYTESTTTNMDIGDSLLSKTVFGLAGNQMNSFTTLDASGNGSVEVDRTLSSTGFVSTASSVSETGGSIHAQFGLKLNGNDLQWMDNATIRNADNASFSLNRQGCNAFVTLTNGSMNANDMVTFKPGWNAWGIHSPPSIKTKVAFNVSVG
jgi:hypothetical protein